MSRDLRLARVEDLQVARLGLVRDPGHGFEPGDAVVVDTGEVAIRAVVTGRLSATHLRVRADDGLVFAAAAADCRRADQRPAKGGTP